MGLVCPSFTSWAANANGTNLDISERPIDSWPLLAESILVVPKLVGSQPLERLTKATEPTRTRCRSARVHT